jgi:hypothetical protein
VYRGGETIAGLGARKSIVNETESTIRDSEARSKGQMLDLLCYDVSLFEEPDAGKPHVRFCEGPGPTDIWLKYGGTAGKPGGKLRKQTSTYSIGETGLLDSIQ